MEMQVLAKNIKPGMSLLTARSRNYWEVIDRVAVSPSQVSAEGVAWLYVWLKSGDMIPVRADEEVTVR